ncbi:hypothetical protein [uncultured Pontibacter sp.]|uniref:DUF7033 domain-containing protein n=1 Tax=uncultured Pontibacter sp. TaxID=453356 RepID=UPI00262BAAF4|nr:hypothetical protein [uncultured Pontibacter sp.]
MYIYDFTLLHFHLLYPKSKALSFNYGAGGAAKINIKKYEGSFFEKKRPRPQQVFWKEWQGVRLPLFFEEDDQQELITYHPDGSASINYDIIASAFFLLSGWQEYYGPERDRFHRYTYKASVQARYNFITKPVVNYYFEMLREVLEKVYGANLQHDHWGNNGMATCLTCNVDRLHSAWHVAGKQLLYHAKAFDLTKVLLQKAVGKDAWFNLPEVMATAEKYGAKTTFFFLPSNQRYNGHPNADHDLTKLKYQNLMQKISDRRHEVALQGSFGTANDLVQLKSDRGKLAQQAQGNRFHYLCFQPETTPQVLQQSNLAYDSTLGFSEHIGFRNSYCHPFYPFDFKNRKAHTYLELPLMLMDASLYDVNFMHLKPKEALEKIQPMLEEVQKFRGLLTILWHNENYSKYNEHPVPKGEPSWREVLETILQQLKAAGSEFYTCAEAAAISKGGKQV